jgi:NAD(P)H-dependent FMN reductase
MFPCGDRAVHALVGPRPGAGSLSTALGLAGLESRIAAVDAVLYVTPEYNRSIPGAL